MSGNITMTHNQVNTNISSNILSVIDSIINSFNENKWGLELTAIKT